MRRTALVAAATLLQLVVPTSAAGQSAPSPAPATAPAPDLRPAPPAPQPARANGWPRALAVQGGTLVVYQPQMEKLEGATLHGRAAISWEAPDKAPTFGVFWYDATLAIDKEARTAELVELNVTRIRFPNLTPEAEKGATKLLEAEIPKWDIGGSLDEITAALAVSEREARSEKGLKSKAPRLVFSQDPAVLLLYDGQPIVRPMEGTALERAVNTPLFVVRDPSTKRFYLGGGTFWYEAEAALGPWKPTAAPSPAVKEFFEKNPPPPPPKESEAAPVVTAPGAEPAGPQPRIVVATEPTELVVFDGKPNYVPVGGAADLLYVDNTDGKVLQHVPSGETYVLVSGRWFKAASLQGPWTAVRPDKLPAAFSRIPPESLAADVRTFVAGTEEAQDALADTQIPQTAAVKRDQKFEVTYDGEPKFKAIEGTNLAYAVNTQFSVIQDSGKFWACHQAVWYVAPTPTGPWTVSDKRPPSIDQVPPSAPVYNTRYVYVYQTTPEVVYVGYLPGYVGMYPYYGTVVYGTGFYYPPYVGPVHYYPYPATFGVHMTYNPWMGFGVGVSYGTPFFSVGIHFGGYGRPYYGPGGYRPPPYPPYGYRPPPAGYRPPAGHVPPGGSGSRPPPGGTASTRPTQGNSNIYNRPQNADRNASRDKAATNRRTAAPAQQPNNVYGDRSGNVYRQNQGGDWDRHTGQGWEPQGGGRGSGPSASTQPAGRPSGGGGAGARPSQGGGAPAGLSRDSAARGRSGGGGGGMRGGGGRR